MRQNKQALIVIIALYKPAGLYNKDLFILTMPKTKELGMFLESPILEAETREEIDTKLVKAGWIIQCKKLDRFVIAPKQIRTIIQNFIERVFKDIFSEQSDVLFSGL